MVVKMDIQKAVEMGYLLDNEKVALTGDQTEYKMVYELDEWKVELLELM